MIVSSYLHAWAYFCSLLFVPLCKFPYSTLFGSNSLYINSKLVLVIYIQEWEELGFECVVFCVAQQYCFSNFLSSIKRNKKKPLHCLSLGCGRKCLASRFKLQPSYSEATMLSSAPKLCFIYWYSFFPAFNVAFMSKVKYDDVSIAYINT